MKLRYVIRRAISRVFADQVEPVRTTGYLVLGMHRSGTSCLTGLLETCGLWTGVEERSARYNAKGNLEAPGIRAVNDEILEQCGGTWRDPPLEVTIDKVDTRPLAAALRPFHKHERWLLKDPRMLLTLDAWLPLIPACQFIGTFRHPESVADSLAKRGKLAVAHEVGRSLWTRYNRILVQLHRERKFPLVNFDVEGDRYIRRFHHLCRVLHLEYDEDRAKAFYEQGLVCHHHGGIEGLSGEAADLYSYLLEHQLQEDDSSDM